MSFYDLQGKELPFHRNDYAPYHDAKMPENFNQMIEISREIAHRVDCPFVRIDLYSICNETFFSEITFTPCSGYLPFEPQCADTELGKMIKVRY